MYILRRLSNGLCSKHRHLVGNAQTALETDIWLTDNFLSIIQMQQNSEQNLVQTVSLLTTEY
jgi:hypothetical protein